MKAPRIMLAAPASGSGKTLITCGVLQALLNRHLRIRAFKCGPDYIDPMFHGKVLGVPSKNLDTFFTDKNTTRYLFAKEALQADISIMEGVMGFYDGIGGVHTRASAYELAKVTKTPVVLIVDCKGMSLSVAALIRGFLEYQKDSGICGVILNRLSAGLYPNLKKQIEAKLPVQVLGYVPKAEAYVIESRHLGLVMPGEIQGWREKLSGLAAILEDTLDLDALMELAARAEEITCQPPEIPRLALAEKAAAGAKGTGVTEEESVAIGIADDEVFCFYYQDNLELMEEMGARLVRFSPLKDAHLPKGLDGLIFYGGYPELYARALSENETMKRDIRQAIFGGMPYLAECGGFLYLHEHMEDMEGNLYPMVGIVQGKAYKTNKLSRFGYVKLQGKKSQIFGEKGVSCKGHEFHYFDSTNNGEDFLARKPLSKRQWDCMHADEYHAAGFPHLYYYSNPDMIFRFLTTCKEGRRGCYRKP